MLGVEGVGQGGALRNLLAGRRRTLQRRPIKSNQRDVRKSRKLLGQEAMEWVVLNAPKRANEMTITQTPAGFSQWKPVMTSVGYAFMQ